jgi:hypothetical protein
MHTLDKKYLRYLYVDIVLVFRTYNILPLLPFHIEKFAGGGAKAVGTMHLNSPRSLQVSERA